MLLAPGLLPLLGVQYGLFDFKREYDLFNINITVVGSGQRREESREGKETEVHPSLFVNSHYKMNEVSMGCDVP